MPKAEHSEEQEAEAGGQPWEQFQQVESGAGQCPDSRQWWRWIYYRGRGMIVMHNF